MFYVRKTFCVILILLFSSVIYADEVRKDKFENIELLNKVLHVIQNSYYREIDQKKLINGAIKGMMATLDPHSSFLDEDVFKKMREDTQGEFGGLGIEVTQKDGIIVVITPIDDTPAFKAGIKSGDRIVEINGESTIGFPLDEAVDQMRGLPNTKIKIGIMRDGVQGMQYFTLKRQVIKVKPIKSALLDDSFLYLRLSSFQKRSAKSIVSEIKKMKKQLGRKKANLQGMIFDLRSNPGGLLDEAINVSSIFLKEGVVVSTEGRDPKEKQVHSVKGIGYKDLDLPLVVLINGASASASEIVAGALQDFNRAIIMGETSFGKGSVQTIAKITEKQGVKLTIAQYMTPLGRKIQAEGIVPDVKIGHLSDDWKDQFLEEKKYIRERDLRNHLTSTIESKQEKELRISNKERDKVERKLRYEKNQKSEDVKKSKTFKKYDPFNDFQVVQALNYLKSLTVYKRILKK